MLSPSYTEALERSLGQVVSRARGELDLLKAQAEAIMATASAKAAESEARLNALDAAITARLEKLTDGERGDKGEPGERGERGPAGMLPNVKAWASEVHYAGEVVTHAGQTWQALTDTGNEPGSDDWACIAERGTDGRDAPGMIIRGTWATENEYQALDVVALNGAAFVAKIDNPGPCPGEGWQLMSAQGKRGAAGERGDKGDKGDRGEPGATIKAVSLDDFGVFSFDLTNGQTVQCDARSVLERIITAARDS
jgi:hypothetical protein